MSARLILACILAAAAGAASVPQFDTTPAPPKVERRVQRIVEKLDTGLAEVTRIRALQQAQCDRDRAAAKAAYDEVTLDGRNIDTEAAVAAWKRWSDVEKQCKEIF